MLTLTPTGEAQTTGARCGDGRTKGDWECPGSYTTDKCTVRASCVLNCL